jgi:hypothetical protein
MHHLLQYLRISTTACMNFVMIFRMYSDYFLKQHLPTDLCNGDAY